MACKLAAVEALAMGAVLLAGAAAEAQEHVRLMPQLGIGHVNSVAFSPNGRFVVTGSSSHAVWLWDVATGQQVRAFEGHSDMVASVAFSPDGRFVLAGSDGGKARLWDASTGQQIRSFAGGSQGPMHSVAFSPDDHFVLTSGWWDNTARLWDIATGRRVRSFVHTAAVESVAFSPDGKSVVTGSLDHTARMWDTATGNQIREFDGNMDAVLSVAFSSNGRFVVTGSRDNTARLWDVITGQQVRSFIGHTDSVFSVAISPDCQLVLTGGADGTARLWDAATGQELRSFEVDSPDSVAFSPDGHSMIVAAEIAMRLFDVATGQQIRSFAGHTSDVSSVAFSPDGRSVVTGKDNIIRLWDAATGQQIRSFAGHQGHVTCVAFSPNGRSLVSGSWDKTVRLWDIDTGQQIRIFAGSENSVTSVAFSPDGRFLVGGSKDGIARLWVVATGQQIRPFKGHETGDISVAYSPDGHYLITGGQDNTARLWDAATGQQIRVLEGHKSEEELVDWARSPGITSVAYSPDGRFVVVGSRNGRARLCDAATGHEIRAFTGHIDSVTSVAFSPDGHFIVTGSDDRDRTARLWDVATGQQVRAFEGHSDMVASVAFSPDGRFVLTGSSDTTARLWDAGSGRQLATILSFKNGGWAVTDPDGRYDSNDPDNTPGLVWVTESNRVIELTQLKDNYYTPNLLGSIMKGERLPSVNGLDLVPAPPDVAIASPYQPESKRLVLTINDMGGGVGRLVVSVNDRKAAVLERPVTRRAAKSGGKADVTVDMGAATLKPGKNTISAYAFDTGNQIRSHEAVATFTMAAQNKGFPAQAGYDLAADYKPQFYSIVVGTASFPSSHAMDLLYPAHDAESMMTGLEIGADHLFGKDNVHLRLLTTDATEESGQPTKVNIAAAFADVMQKAKPTDVLLVYLSGHGVNLRTEKDSYYYLTTDARSLEIENNPELRALSTVSAAELKQWMGAKNMPLKEVLIMDTCAAGAANDELLKLVEKRDVPPDQRRAIEFLKEATGTVILMGSAADKVSYEASKYGQGLLTYALLDGMRGRSIGDGSRLNVLRWFQNASEDVPQLAQSIGGIQKPVIAAPSGTGFPVALLDSVDEARIPLAAIKPELLHLSCHDADDHDPLGLAAMVRADLREIGQPSARGLQKEPPILYYDDMNDGPAGSLTPKIVYSVSGATVSLRLRIDDQGGKTVREERLKLSGADKNALANAVAAKLVAMAGQIAPEGANH
jgi:WD40 repeat protein